MGKKISFWWDAEKRIRVARAGEQDSLFYEAYRQALAGVAEIVRASIMQVREYDFFFPQSEHDGQNEPRTTCDSQYLYDYPNNIIVFSGERGAGKSSAMLTFVSGLKDKDGLLFKDDFLSGMVACELPNAKAPMVKQMLQTCSFVDLAPIDPTTLEDDGQILTVILARMFRLASSAWESGSNRFGPESSAKRLDEKNQLIQKFSDCYEHIRAIKNGGEPKPEYDGLETLAELGDSSRLKVELYELVEQLLKFCRPEAGDSSYLVLQIDDTDMNIKKAYDILEDVRRYLVIPRLIIVMAADLRHLTQVVESSLLKDYDKSLDSRHEYVEKITHQYITKLFPQTRQIDLPSLGTYLKEHTESISIRYQVPGDILLPDDKKGKTFSGLQDQIFRLIYRKTGIVFLKQEHRLHPIIPCNMRLLAHFLSMLIQMEDVDNPDAEEPSFFLRHPDAVNTYAAHADKLHTRLQNIQRFRNYFLATWVNNSLDSKSVQLFKDLERTDVADRIRYICVRLSSLWSAEKAEPSLKTSGNNGNSQSNAAIIGSGQYADMARICQDIAEHSWDEELRRLTFALQTYCSLFAQMLAVEDLIDYYDACASKERRAAAAKEAGGDEEGEEATQYVSESNGLGCSFSRLHLLFGPRLFPYFPENGNETVTMKLPDNVSRAGERLLDISWQPKTKPSLTELNAEMNVRQCATLLYSMLADYQPPDDGEDIWFDLTRPITNCLYLGDDAGLTPFSREIPGAVPLNATMIGEEPWHTMGNSSLITVLNCDVQTKIGAVLRRGILTSEGHESMENEIDYSNWITRVKGMYTVMKDSLGKSFPIKFLESIDFSKWMEPVAMKGVEELKDWGAIVTSLGAGLTYTPPPVPAGGDSKPVSGGDSHTAQAVPDEGQDQSKQATLESQPPEGDKTVKPE